MRLRLLMLFCCLSFSLIASAQASGGQIRRNTSNENANSVRNPKRSTNYSCTGKENGHEYVDLGLSVRWATCNMGSNSPDGNGFYFAWGETSPRTDYAGTSQNSIRRDIGNNISGSAYDAAHVNWGGKWRMPTKNEVQELIDNCKWKHTKYNGTDGFCITGPNGKSIFIPDAGYYSERKRCSGNFIKLWTATAELDSQYNLCWVYHLYIDNNIYQNPPVQPKLIRESYYVGMCIRPVIY